MQKLTGKCPFCYQDVGVFLEKDDNTCAVCGKNFSSRTALETYAKYINRLLNGDNNIDIDISKNVESNAFNVVDGILIKYLGQSKIIHMPEGIIGIGSDAFRNVSFDELYVASTVRIVKKLAFSTDRQSTNKTNGVIIFPENSDLTEIEDAAFSSRNVNTIVLPTSIKKMGSNVFKDSQLICYYGDKKDFYNKFNDSYIHTSIYKYDKENSRYGLSRWSNLVFDNYKGYDKQNGFTYVYNERGACIVNIPKKKDGVSSFTFPNMFGDKPVFMISRFAYQKAGEYNSIYLPNGLIEIPDFAFNSSDAFFEDFGYVFVPKTVKNIGRYGIKSGNDKLEIKFEEGILLDTWVDFCVTGDNHNDVKTRDLSYESSFSVVKITSLSKDVVYIYSNYAKSKLEIVATIRKGETIDYRYPSKKNHVIYADHCNFIKDVLTQIHLDKSVKEVILNDAFLTSKIQVKKYIR